MDDQIKDTCAMTAFNIVKDNGGYAQFEEYDKLYADPKVYRPCTGTLVGWGDPCKLKHNNGVISAMLAVDKGLLIKEEDGYRINP